jgi:mono/diheme cytochrome c family protein
MSRRDLILSLVAGVVVVVALGVGVGYAWISTSARALLSRQIVTHQHEIPVPWPLSDTEIAEVRARMAAELAPVPAVDEPGGDVGALLELPAPEPSAEQLAEIARERAIARGTYLLKARYPCGECHGHDYGGGTMVEDPMLGGLYGPNLTSGAGGVVGPYRTEDWDRIIRHGVKPGGEPAVMPSIDFFAMSDQELSDIIATLRAMPPVDRPSRPVKLGPLGMFLLSTGGFPLSADRLDDHGRAHVVVPPSRDDTLTYGGHVAQPCAGCHRPDFTGGPIPGGPPDWPPAANLTPHADGLGGWSYEDFLRVMREAKRPDGTDLRPPMSLMPTVAREMDDEDLRSMFAYFQSLGAAPTGR